MKRIDIVRALSLVGALMGLIAIGCHADANDPAGQANELSDSVRRENAVANLQRLYSTALADAGGDRAAAGPRAIADASITQLTSTYVDHPEDVSNGEHILDLLAEMREQIRAGGMRLDVPFRGLAELGNGLPRCERGWSDATREGSVVDHRGIAHRSGID